MSIAIESVSKHFGAFQALNEVNLDIASGELVALLGQDAGARFVLEQQAA